MVNYTSLSSLVKNGQKACSTDGISYPMHNSYILKIFLSSLLGCKVAYLIRVYSGTLHGRPMERLVFCYDRHKNHM